MPRRLAEYRVPLLRLFEYAWRLAVICLCLFAIRFLQQTSGQLERIANLIALEGSYIRTAIEVQGDNANAQLLKLNTTGQVMVGRFDSQLSHARIENQKQAKTAEVTAKQESKKIQEALTETLQPTQQAVEKMADKVAVVAAKPDEHPQVVVQPAPVTVMRQEPPKPQEKLPEAKPAGGRWGNFWRALTFREIH